MSVLKKVSVDFLFELEELNEEKYDFYRNTYNMRYEKRLPHIDQDAIREIKKLKPKMYYIFSCLLSDTNFNDATWLKLGFFIDFFYHRKAVFMTCTKSFSLIKNKRTALFWFDYYIGAMEECGSEAIRFYDRRRKIRIGVYEFLKFDAEDDEDEEEEDPVKPINGDTTFYADKFVSCLEVEPKVIFIRCGHIDLCKACYNNPQRENKNECPSCRKESIFVRDLTKNLKKLFF